MWRLPSDPPPDDLTLGWSRDTSTFPWRTRGYLVVTHPIETAAWLNGLRAWFEWVGEARPSLYGALPPSFTQRRARLSDACRSEQGTRARALSRSMHHGKHLRRDSHSFPS